ncbi:uncharacterized protein LOC102808442 [Saccoglossus kowalevskii]|uniref:Uncharacterized protein LOC102808442 n=1 Tax=Saccoglossus kowalevskii TaxID=10224 RepID=A0ABM0M270_SACKO|nr:PREDICTED: uncharacterized protein LOC102808442 [Saccoglossus kowalevskii]
MMRANWIRLALTSSIQNLAAIPITTAYYLPVSMATSIQDEASRRGLRLIQPTVEFPSTKGDAMFTSDNYYKYRDVERVPKALRHISESLESSLYTGGIICLDTDHPDTALIIVFLLDYLIEKTPYKIVSLHQC